MQYEAHSYEVDVLSCSCGGHFRIVSVLRHDPVVPKILAHLGLPTGLPKTKPARASPSVESSPFGDNWDPCVGPPAWEEPVYDADTGNILAS